MYKYQASNKVWLPVYCITDADLNQIIYSKWDQQQTKWVSYLIQEGGAFSTHFLWSDTMLPGPVKGVYPYLKAWDIDAEFEKVNIETSYRIVSGR